MVARKLFYTPAHHFCMPVPEKFSQPGAWGPTNHHIITECEFPATPSFVARADKLRQRLSLIPTPSPRIGTPAASRPSARIEGGPGKWILRLKRRCNFSTSLLNVLTQCKNDDAITTNK